MSRQLTLCPRRQRVQDVDRQAYVQAFPQPTRHRRPRVDPKPLRLVPRSQDVDGIVRHAGRRRDVGELPSVRAPKFELAVGQSFHLISLFVNRAMVPATEQRQVRERGRPASCPVADVMPLAERPTSAREAAAFVAMVQHAPERGRNGPGTGADLFDPAIRSVPHHHPARVARQALRRFRGNVRAVLEDRLPRTWTTTWYRSPGAPGSIPW